MPENLPRPDFDTLNKRRIIVERLLPGKQVFCLSCGCIIMKSWAGLKVNDLETGLEMVSSDSCKKNHLLCGVREHIHVNPRDTAV